MSRACTIDELRPWPENVTPKGKVYPVPEVGPLPRVTTVIDSTVGIWSRFLNEWYAKMERAAVLETIRTHFAWADGMTPDSFVGLIENHLGEGRAAVRAMEAAGDIGTQVHKHIQAYLRRELGMDYHFPALSDGAEVATMAWEDWWRAAGYRPIRVEQVLWDETLGYAGCVDLIAEDKAGRLGILDWKSSNYILLKHHVQVASYLNMGNNWRPMSWARIVRVPKTLADVNIEDKALGDMYDPEKRVEFTVPYGSLMEGFKAARTLYRIFIERDFGGPTGNGRAGS